MMYAINFLRRSRRFRYLYMFVVFADEDHIAVPDLLRRRPSNQSKRRFSFKTVGESKKTSDSLKSRLISGPSNFSHIAHMGTDQQMRRFVDPPKKVGVHVGCV